MPHYRYWTADGSDLTQSANIAGREFSLSLFSEDFLMAAHPNAKAELRSKSRGVVLLCSLIRDLQKEMSLAPRTGVYLCCGFGPAHPKTQQIALQAPPSQRLSLLDKALPPKDYFISNPGLKAGQVSIEFGLHGPWVAFLSPLFGFTQAIQAARADLRDGMVDGALIGGLFMLDEPTQWASLVTVQGQQPGQLTECVWVHYASKTEQIFSLSEGPPGRYGPLSSTIERIQLDERSQQ